MGGTIQATDTPGGWVHRGGGFGHTTGGWSLMTKILVIDDEPQILRALRINLFRGEIDGERIGFDDRFIRTCGGRRAPYQPRNPASTSMSDISGSPRSRTTYMVSRTSTRPQVDSASARRAGGARREAGSRRSHRACACASGRHRRTGGRGGDTCRPGRGAPVTAICCDASAVVTLLVDAGSDGVWAAETFAGATLYASALLPFECASIIGRHEAAGLIGSDRAAQAAFRFGRLGRRAVAVRRHSPAGSGIFDVISAVTTRPTSLSLRPSTFRW